MTVKNVVIMYPLMNRMSEGGHECNTSTEKRGKNRTVFNGDSTLSYVEAYDLCTELGTESFILFAWTFPSLLTAQVLG